MSEGLTDPAIKAQDNGAPEEPDRDKIGDPTSREAKSLRGFGRLWALADCLWIPQAALIAFVLANALGGFLTAEQLGTAMETNWRTLLGPLLGFCILAVLRAWLQSKALQGAFFVSRAIQSRTRKELLAAASSVSPAAPFPSSGAFAAHLTEQVDHLGPYYRSFLPQERRLKIVPLAIVLATACVSWLAALILVVCGPLIPVFMALIGSRAKAANADQQVELARLSGTLLDRVRGLETLKLFGAVDRTEQDIRQAGEKFRHGTMRVLRIAFLSSTVLELFSALGIAFVAVYVGFSLLGDITIGLWQGSLSYWQGLFILLLAPEFFAPLRAYAAAYHDRAAGLAAREKLAEIFGDLRAPNVGPQKDLKTVVNPLRRGELGPAVRLEHIRLTLGNRTIFDDLNLEIYGGDTLLLHGPSGSGKTTLLDLLMGFHTPKSGSFSLAGQTVLPEELAGMRRQIMWLGQRPRLFHGSLRANLLRGADHTETVSEEDLWQALRVAGAEELVHRLPRGLATQLGEDGFGLSVGEMRRVALARAAMRKDAVLLLADEPTAGLDEKTAADVIDGLQALAEKRTAVIATHDPAVLKLPGRTLDLRALNRVCEVGAHA